jgi:hypothetical protein
MCYVFEIVLYTFIVAPGLTLATILIYPGPYCVHTEAVRSAVHICKDSDLCKSTKIAEIAASTLCGLTWPDLSDPIGSVSSFGCANSEVPLRFLGLHRSSQQATQ